MNRQKLKHDLWLAKPHIAKARRMLPNNVQLIAELEVDGHNQASAKDLLAELENGARLHEADRDVFVQALDPLR